LFFKKTKQFVSVSFLQKLRSSSFSSTTKLPTREQSNHISSSFRSNGERVFVKTDTLGRSSGLGNSSGLAPHDSARPWDLVNDGHQVSCLPSCLQRVLGMDTTGVLSSMDKSLLKIHLANGSFHQIKCGEVTNVKVGLF